MQHLAKTFSIAIPVQDLCQQNSRVDGFSKIQSEWNGWNGSNYLGIRGIPKNRKKHQWHCVLFKAKKNFAERYFWKTITFWAEGFLGDTIFWSFSSIIKSFEDLKKIGNQIKLSLRRKSAVSGFPSLYSFFLFFRDAELFRYILSFVSKHLTVSSM